jgi:hypothetical protein
MALIKFGSIITDSRGKVGGLVLRMTRWGNTLNVKARTTAARTARQAIAGAILSNTATDWNTTLSESEREDWRTLAATQFSIDAWGNARALTGIALFTRVNSARLAAGLSLITTAPADQAVTTPLTATLTITAGPTLSIAWTTTPAPANHRVKIYCTRPMSQGTIVAQKKYQFVQLSAAAAASPLDITAAYTALFGPPQGGRRIYAQLAFWNQTNGAQSARLYTSADT